MVGLDLLRAALCGDPGGFLDDHLEEHLERFRCGSLSRQRRMLCERAVGDVQMTTGVACATLPTSSSFCMMRLMRACAWRRAE